MSEPTLIGSVQKALRLLQTVAAGDGVMPAKKLARLTDLPLPTTYHLLRTLTFEGYLRKAEGGYLIGPTAVMASEDPLKELLPRIRPVLRSLAAELGGATYLSLFDAGEIRLVAIAEEPSGQQVDLWVGVQESAHATAFGKAILASLDAEERADYLNRHDLYDLTPHTITSRGTLARQLADDTSIWSDEQEYLLGVSCLAAPVAGGGLRGAVAVSLPAQRPVSPGDRLALSRAAARLRRTFGTLDITI